MSGFSIAERRSTRRLGASRAALFLVVAAVLLVVAAGVPTAFAAERAKTLVVAASAEPDTLDPAIAYAVGDVKFIRGAYEKLVAYQGGTTEVDPQLAVSWSASPDGKEWTFNLRKNVKFADGTPFNADAVKFTYERLLKIDKGPAWMFTNIGEIKVIDPYTVKFILKRADASFLYVMANLSGTGIVNPKAVKEHDVNGDLGQAWLKEHTAGTGAYQLTNWVHGQKLEMAKNPNYWGGWKGQHLDGMLVRIVQEPATQRMLLESGEVDIANGIGMDDIPIVAKEPGISLISKPSFGMQTIFLNVTHKPLDNEKVRQAIARAIDYDQVVKYIYNGAASQAQGPIPKGLWGHDDKLPMFKRDVAQAKKLLAEAGYGDGFAVSFFYGAGSAERRKVAELVQANLKDIGITVKLTELQGNTIIDMEKKPDTGPDMSMWGWWPDYADPGNYLLPQWRSDQTPDTGNFNHGWYKNPEFDKVIDQALTTTDHAKRVALYAKAQRIIADDVPAIPLIQTVYRFLMRDWVKGYVYNPMYEESYDLYNMYIKR